MQDALQVFDDLTTIDGQPMTTSRKVAARFKKAHKTVLRSIKRIEAAQPEFSRLNFVPRDYVDERCKSQPEYLMTRDGFALLAMGFTGDAAMSWKIVYINAFNAMAEEIARAALSAPSIGLEIHQRIMAYHAQDKVTYAMAKLGSRSMNDRKAALKDLREEYRLLEGIAQLQLFLAGV